MVMFRSGFLYILSDVLRVTYITAKYKNVLLCFGTQDCYIIFISVYRDNAENTQPIHGFDCSMTGCVFVMSHMVGYDTFLDT